MTTALDATPALAIDPAAAAALFHEAHTAYSFTDEPVTDVELETIYDLVRHAPTAMNAQPLRVTFLRGSAKERLLPHLAEGNRAKSASAPVVAILGYDVDFHEELPRVLPNNPGAKDNFANPEGREGFARFNASIQTGYFILAARAVGLDAGPMAGFDNAGVDTEFFADTAHRSLLVVNLGHVADNGNFPRNPRLDFSEAAEILG